MAVDRLTAIGWGLISFAIVVGLGLVVLQKFSEQTSGTANTTIQYVITQMGSSGLTGWLSLIIVVLIAGLVLSYFRVGKGNSY